MRMQQTRSTREVIIETGDLAGAVRFYESVLGFPVSHRGDSLVGFETGAFCLYVEEGSLRGPTFEFLVADFDAARAMLLEAGCRIVSEDPDVPRCYLRDPFGLVFNLAGQRQAEA